MWWFNKYNMKMKKLYSLLAVAVFGGLMVAEASPRTQDEIMSAARSVLAKQKQGGARFAQNPSNFKTLHQTASITVVGFENDADGFAIVANDDLMPAVLAVADSKFTGEANPNFKWWLNAIEAVCAESVENNVAPRTVPAPDPAVYPERVDPLVQSTWDQDSPYWNLCPTRNGNLCLTGCVATAIAQVFYTNKYPATGRGTRTNTSASPVTANFGETEYRYDLMLDSYVPGQYSDAEAEAVATLMLHCGVAVNMDYDPNGSGAYSDQAADGIRTYFGVETAYLVEREYYTDEEWMDMVYNELAGGHPMYYSGVDYSGWQAAGHAFVCDGYDEDGRVHINWGWSGSDNGFFNIDLLNPIGYTFNMYQDMILGMYDPDDVHSYTGLATDTICVETPGQLIAMIEDTMYVHLSGLKVEGNINEADIAFMRELAACDTLSINTFDLSDATIAGNKLPDNAFKDSRVRSVLLPRSLESIGAYAFSACNKLARIRSYSYNVPATGLHCFDGVRPTSMSVSLIAGSADNYTRNAQWKAICNKDNIREFGTTIKANNVNRKYGSPNPVFGFKLYGDRVTGTPVMTCEADALSPVGGYDIRIQAGSVAQNPNVFFVGGTLQVLKTNLTITACDAERGFGQQNPEFTFSYDGFVNGENESVLTVKPQAFCAADAESPLGEYVIEVSGAEAANYSIKYNTGILTVVEGSTVLDLLPANGSTIGNVYTILGEKVLCNDLKDLAPGVYVINGRKTVVRR